MDSGEAAVADLPDAGAQTATRPAADHRAGERGGCVSRVIAGWAGGHLYALDVAQSTGAASGYDGLVGCVGADRQVTIYDPRKWAVRGRWTGALKYEAYSLHFSTSDVRPRR